MITSKLWIWKHLTINALLSLKLWSDGGKQQSSKGCNPNYTMTHFDTTSINDLVSLTRACRQNSLGLESFTLYATLHVSDFLDATFRSDFESTTLVNTEAREPVALFVLMCGNRGACFGARARARRKPVGHFFFFEKREREAKCGRMHYRPHMEKRCSWNVNKRARLM